MDPKEKFLQISVGNKGWKLKIPAPQNGAPPTVGYLKDEISRITSLPRERLTLTLNDMKGHHLEDSNGKWFLKLDGENSSPVWDGFFNN